MRRRNLTWSPTGNYVEWFRRLAVLRQARIDGGSDGLDPNRSAALCARRIPPCKRLHGCGVDDCRALDAAALARRASAQNPAARGLERHPIYRRDRLAMGDVAEGFSFPHDRAASLPSAWRQRRARSAQRSAGLRCARCAAARRTLRRPLSTAKASRPRKPAVRAEKPAFGPAKGRTRWTPAGKSRAASATS